MRAREKESGTHRHKQEGLLVCVCVCAEGVCKLFPSAYCTASLSRHQLLSVSATLLSEALGRRRSNVVRKRKTCPVTEWVVVGHFWVTDGAQRRKKAKVSMRMCSMSAGDTADER